MCVCVYIYIYIYKMSTPGFPGESHGQTGLEGYSPQGHKEPDTTD